jgi:hypothetical protein
MTEADARRTANAVIGLVGVAAACVVLTTPSLRRLAVRAARIWISTTVPLFLLNQAREAWVQSGRRADIMSR